MYYFSSLKLYFLVRFLRTSILKVPACRINDTASCQRWDASGTCKAGVMSSHHWFLESLFKSSCLVDATGSCISLLHGKNPWFGMAARATKWLSSGCKSRLGGVYKKWPMKTFLTSSKVDYLLLQGSTFPSTNMAQSWWLIRPFHKYARQSGNHFAKQIGVKNPKILE